MHFFNRDTPFIEPKNLTNIEKCLKKRTSTQDLKMLYSKMSLIQYSLFNRKLTNAELFDKIQLRPKESLTRRYIKISQRLLFLTLWLKKVQNPIKQNINKVLKITGVAQDNKSQEETELKASVAKCPASDIVDSKNESSKEPQNPIKKFKKDDDLNGNAQDVKLQIMKKLTVPVSKCPASDIVDSKNESSKEPQNPSKKFKKDDDLNGSAQEVKLQTMKKLTVPVCKCFENYIVNSKNKSFKKPKNPCKKFKKDDDLNEDAQVRKLQTKQELTVPVSKCPASDIVDSKNESSKESQNPIRKFKHDDDLNEDTQGMKLQKTQELTVPVSKCPASDIVDSENDSFKEPQNPIRKFKQDDNLNEDTQGMKLQTTQELTVPVSKCPASDIVDSKNDSFKEPQNPIGKLKQDDNLNEDTQVMKLQTTQELTVPVRKCSANDIVNSKNKSFKKPKNPCKKFKKNDDLNENAQVRNLQTMQELTVPVSKCSASDIVDSKNESFKEPQNPSKKFKQDDDLNGITQEMKLQTTQELTVPVSKCSASDIVNSKNKSFKKPKNSCKKFKKNDDLNEDAQVRKLQTTQELTIPVSKCSTSKTTLAQNKKEASEASCIKTKPKSVKIKKNNECDKVKKVIGKCSIKDKKDLKESLGESSGSQIKKSKNKIKATKSSCVKLNNKNKVNSKKSLTLKTKIVRKIDLQKLCKHCKHRSHISNFLEMKNAEKNGGIKTINKREVKFRNALAKLEAILKSKIALQASVSKCSISQMTTMNRLQEESVNETEAKNEEPLNHSKRCKEDDDSDKEQIKSVAILELTAPVSESSSS